MPRLVALACRVSVAARPPMRVLNHADLAQHLLSIVLELSMPHASRGQATGARLLGQTPARRIGQRYNSGRRRRWLARPEQARSDRRGKDSSSAPAGGADAGRRILVPAGSNCFAWLGPIRAVDGHLRAAWRGALQGTVRGAWDLRRTPDRYAGGSPHTLLFCPVQRESRRSSRGRVGAPQSLDASLVPDDR